MIKKYSTSLKFTQISMTNNPIDNDERKFSIHWWSLKKSERKHEKVDYKMKKVAIKIAIKLKQKFNFIFVQIKLSSKLKSF